MLNIKDAEFCFKMQISVKINFEITKNLVYPGHSYAERKKKNRHQL